MRVLKGWNLIVFFVFSASKKTQGKSKEEAVKEKKQELEKRLQAVSGQLGGQFTKKAAKKGMLVIHIHSDWMKLKIIYFNPNLFEDYPVSFYSVYDLKVILGSL